MRKLCLYISILTMPLGELFGQTDNELFKNSMQVSLGSSKHGTDNAIGIAFTAEYSNQFHKKLSYTAFMSATMHDGLNDVNYFNSNGTLIAGKVNFTTAGMQAGLALGYSFYRNKRHHLQSSIGALFRYQSTSNPEIVGIAMPFPYTGLNFPARSLAFGGVAALSYEYTFSGDLFLAARGWLQYDSNEDALNIFSIGFGRRF